eukprot:jgi/Ulvmu1/11118/UM071_0001.1
MGLPASVVPPFVPPLVPSPAPTEQAGVAAVAKDDAGETSPGASLSKGVNKRKAKSETTGGNTDASSRRAKTPKVSFEELAVQYD